MNLYITGGHLTPALAVIDRIAKEHHQTDIYFIGREYSQHGKQHTREQEEIQKRDIPFFSIQAAKYHRAQSWLNLSEIVKFPLAFFQIIPIFLAHKPDVILSFGGYVAFPVCVVGKAWGARIITHEQTKSAGLANQFIAYIADTIALSSESSRQFFPKNKSVVTGNPIRESLLHEYTQPPKWFPPIAKTKPFLYVTGGSQGSQIINRTIAAILPKLTRDFVVIHQCGASKDHEYVRELESEREKLAAEYQSSYVVREWIEEKEVSYLFAHAREVISRAGANTVEELLFAATPTIFIPLAFAYNDEQYKNIVPMLKAGSSECILQKDLLPDTLYSMVLKVDRNYEAMKNKATQLKASGIKDGTQRLVKLVVGSH